MTAPPATLLPSEATHSSLDLFEKDTLLISFKNSFEQRVGPIYSPNGPTLEFKFVGDRSNFIDLQNIFLELTCRIVNDDGTNLRTHATDPAQRDTPVLVNNVLHSLFSDCDVFANGTKVSTSNGTYAHKAFLETEFSFSKAAKDTWQSCQGYTYESDPGDETLPAFVNRRTLTAASAPLTLYGRLSVDFFNCDKLMLPDVSIRIKLVH